MKSLIWIIIFNGLVRRIMIYKDDGMLQCAIIIPYKSCFIVIHINVKNQYAVVLSIFNKSRSYREDTIGGVFLPMLVRR